MKIMSYLKNDFGFEECRVNFYWKVSLVLDSDCIKIMKIDFEIKNFVRKKLLKNLSITPTFNPSSICISPRSLQIGGQKHRSWIGFVQLLKKWGNFLVDFYEDDVLSRNRPHFWRDRQNIPYRNLPQIWSRTHRLVGIFWGWPTCWPHIS